MATTPVHRPARTFAEPPPTAEIRLVPPPQVQSVTTGGWLQYMLPLTGVLGSVGFIAVYNQGMSGSGRLIYLVLVAGGTLAAMGGGVALRHQQVAAQRRSRRAAERRYVAYLEREEEAIRRVAELQRGAAVRVHPDLATAPFEIARRDRLWERRPEDADFLEARVGVGSVPLACPLVLDAANNPLVEYDARLLGLARGLVDAYASVPAMPASIGLGDQSSVVVSGPRERARGLVRAVLCELATFHSPDDLHVLAAYAPDAAPHWEWLKWLPHVRRGRAAPWGSPVCRLADGPDALAELLDEEIGPRLEQLRRGALFPGTPPLPRVVVVVDGMAPASPLARVPALAELMDGGRAVGAVVVGLTLSRHEEPSTVSLRVDVDEGGVLTVEEARAGGRRQRGASADDAPVALCEAVARALAPLRPASPRGGGAAPDLSGSVRLLDLLGIAGAGDVRPDAAWPVLDRQGLLRVPIGVTAGGEPLDLDLKEAAEGGMGPHGMLIGATGSGKSELLRSLVTALAVTHSPELLSFVFVDFKGGAAFADLAELPHCAGLITNLSTDLTRVDRMRLALGGELERRQRMLRDAGNLDSIRDYHRARGGRRPATDLPPMPYLVAVVDEFGELLASRPDFLDLFIGIGRVGRSVGMHLLLSSQRLEEGRIRGLEGHLRYRLCLRTFSAQESASVIGTADAFTLPAFPGAGYLKVDSAVYTRFKSAIATSPHRPRDGALRGGAAAVLPFAGVRRAGSDGASAAPEAAATSEMRVVVRALRARGRTAGVHQVWLPPLQPAIALDTVLAWGRRRHLRVPIGLVDHPAEQRQIPHVVDLSGSDGHLAVVGAPQTGKSMALRTLVTAFALTHSPRDLQIYVIDLGGGTLFGVEKLPQVGAVCGRGDRDRIRRVVREMQAIIEDREILFRRHGVDGMASFRRLVASGAVERSVYGDVLLVIDNWARLRHDVEECEADVQQIVATGLSYGVHVILATNRWGELRTAVRDSMGLRLELRLNDPVESDVGRVAAQSLPAGVPGRALTQAGHQVQIALPRIDGVADASGLERCAEEIAAKVARRWQDAEHAPPVQTLPALVTPADLAARVERRSAGSARPPGVPLGVEEFRLEPVFVDLFGADPHLVVLGDAECGKTTLLRALVAGLGAGRSPEELRVWLVDYRRTLVDVADDPRVTAYAVTAPMVRDHVDRLGAILTERLPGATVSRAELGRRRWWSGPEHVLVVDDYDLLTGASGNPLQPLTDLLSQARDVGFHVVVARRVGGAARGSFETVYQRLRELGTPGFIMSGDPQEGVLVGTQKAMALPAGRGLLVRRGHRTALVQAVHVAPRAP